MNDEQQPKAPEGSAQQQGGNAGYVDEAAPAGDAHAAPPQPRSAAKGNKGAELKANFLSVFGHGIGKVALIAAGIVVVVLIAAAFRGFNTNPSLDKETTQVDVPGAPPANVSVEPIDEREAQRRAEQARKEAEAAARKGQTYQPDFNPAVVANLQPGQPGYTQPQLNVGEQVRPAPAPVVPISVATGQSSANGGAGTSNSQQIEQEEQRRQQAENDKQLAAREKYVEQLRGGVRDQVEELLGGKNKDGGIRGAGSYSVATYLPRQVQPPSTAVHGGAPSTPTPPNPGAAPKDPPIFKAGKAIFATLDSEVNTDDGGEVFATVHGGKYDGAKLIGKIEQAPRNIRLRFSVLAPQDDRPTLNVNAIAIREQDAKQGVAESIDNHTLERYTALFAGSILSGFGKAANQSESSSVVLPNGQVIVSQPEITNKRITMYALGEVGMNAGAEIRKSFTQPPTYSTPAKKGIGVIFLNDVTEK